MLYLTRNEAANIKIEYFLLANFIPLNENDWADKARGLSSFCSSQNIYIFRPPKAIEDNPQTLALRNRIGGFLGIGATECVSEIFFDRNAYNIGDIARVRIICDNSRCKKAVKEFKLKLHRKVVGRVGRATTVDLVYPTRIKVPAECPAFTKVDRTYEIRIPDTD
jgi:hypothetical protein